MAVDRPGQCPSASARVITEIEVTASFCQDTGTRARYILPVKIQHFDEGVCLATSPALPGFLVQATTVEEIMELAPGIAQALIEAMQQNRVPLPDTLQTAEPSFHAELPTPVRLIPYRSKSFAGWVVGLFGKLQDLIKSGATPATERT